MKPRSTVFLSLRMPRDLAREMDAWIGPRGFRNRSHLMETACIELIALLDDKARKRAKRREERGAGEED